MRIDYIKGTNTVDEINIFVNQSHQVNGNGSEESPYNNIGDAIATAKSSNYEGKHIIITIVGNYYVSETITISGTKNHITITSDGGKVYGGTKVSSSKSGGVTSFSTSNNQYCIVADGEIKWINKSCADSSLSNYIVVNAGSITKSGEDYVINNSSLANISNVGSVVSLCCQYNNFTSVVKEVGANTIKIGGEYVSDRLLSNKVYARVFGSVSNSNNNAIYTNDGNCYLGADADEIIVPSVVKIIQISNCANINIDGVDFVGNKYVNCSAGQAARYFGSAISIENSVNISVKNNSFNGINSYCIRIGGGCKRCFLNDNELNHLGGGGIYVGSESSCIEGISIYGNTINDFGKINQTFVGILVTNNCKSILIKENVISEGYYSGISAGMSWGYNTDCYNVHIIKNHVINVLKGNLNDGAGIYVLSNIQNAVIEYNKVEHIHDINDNDSSAVYLDEGSTNVLVRYNILYDADKLIKVNYGRNNIVYNNILCKASVAAVITYDYENQPVMAISNVIIDCNDIFTGTFYASCSTAYHNIYNTGNINIGANIINNVKVAGNVILPNYEDGNFSMTNMEIIYPYAAINNSKKAHSVVWSGFVENVIQ